MRLTVGKSIRIAALLCTLFCGVAAAQTIIQQNRILHVKYATKIETVRIEWMANLRVESSQTGEAASTLGLKFKDDRDCQWRIWGELQRRLVTVDPVNTGENVGEAKVQPMG